MISRRIFLRNALTVSAATWAAGLGLIGLSRQVRKWLFPRRLPAAALDLVRSLDLGAEAGRRVTLRTHERRDLLDRTDRFLAAAAAGPDLSGRLRQRIADDFAAGRLVSVDDWYLAETEAGLFLVAADLEKGLYRAS